MAAIWSRDTASSPPTFTVAPGTASCSTERTLSTWLCPVIGSSVLRTRDDDQTGAPVGGAQLRIAACCTRWRRSTTPGSADTFWLAASTAARVAGSSTGLPDTTATMLGPVPLALSRILKPLHRLRGAGPVGVLEVVEHPAAHNDPHHEQHQPADQHEATVSINPAPDCTKHADHLPSGTPPTPAGARADRRGVDPPSSLALS